MSFADIGIQLHCGATVQWNALSTTEFINSSSFDEDDRITGAIKTFSILTPESEADL